MSDQERLHGLCLEYALGTLEGEERREIERLLEAGDVVAERAMEEAHATVAALALAAPEATPGPDVKTRLMAEVEREAAVVDFPAEGKRSLKPLHALGWAVAAAALVFAVLARQEVNDLRLRMADLEQRHERALDERDELAESAARFERIRNILSAPETRAVSLEAAQQPKVNAFWNESLGLVLAGSNLPAPDPGRTLQLWIVPKEGAPISVDVFQPSPDGAALLVAGTSTPFDDAAALAISDEPAGGSAAPTTTPIWVGPLG